MTKKIAVAVAVFALLISPAPTLASTIDASDAFNLNFGNGFNISGGISFTYVPQLHIFFPNPAVTLTFDGTPLPRFTPPPNEIPLGDPLFGLEPIDFATPNPPHDFLVEFVYPLNPIPTSVLDFTLGGRPPISGDVTVTFTDELSPPSPVPLPAALPLFGSAVLGLAGFAWRRGKVSA